MIKFWKISREDDDTVVVQILRFGKPVAHISLSMEEAASFATDLSSIVGDLRVHVPRSLWAYDKMVHGVTCENCKKELPNDMGWWQPPKGMVVICNACYNQGHHHRFLNASIQPRKKPTCCGYHWTAGSKDSRPCGGMTAEQLRDWLNRQPQEQPQQS